MIVLSSCAIGPPMRSQKAMSKQLDELIFFAWDDYRRGRLSSRKIVPRWPGRSPGAGSPRGGKAGARRVRLSDDRLRRRT